MRDATVSLTLRPLGASAHCVLVPSHLHLCISYDINHDDLLSILPSWIHQLPLSLTTVPG